MSLRAFLYAADALRLEEGVEFTVQVEGRPVPQVPSPSDVRAQNARAMQMFQGMMGGVQRKKR